MHGLLNCIEMLMTNSITQDLVHNELHFYDNRVEDMKISTTIRARSTMHSDLWWNKFINDCPNHKLFAIKILSQTFSATECKKN
ncbi:hypothetical protein EJ110_NYTH12993 [Nymphaea thermarum]|nr:hypothetical protein EJ110_NYTH12993 [Nymphaea thermarum]